MWIFRSVVPDYPDYSAVGNVAIGYVQCLRGVLVRESEIAERGFRG